MDNLNQNQSHQKNKESGESLTKKGFFSSFSPFLNASRKTPFKAGSIKQKQKMTLWGIIVIGVFLLWLIWNVLDTSSQKDVSREPRGPKKEETFSTALKHVNSESVWIEQAQSQIEKTKQANSALQQQIELLSSAKDSSNHVVEQQASAMRELEQRLKVLENRVSAHAHEGSTSSTGSGAALQSGDGFLTEDTLSLQPTAVNYNSVNTQTLKTFVPAGTFVRAILLGGADASAGVTSQANPTPMLLRLLDPGTLPNHEKSRLKNCVATAAAVGDISSERGQIRLERLSCTHEDGTVTEIPVEATVFGPDGKNGVRGIPVWRESALLERAFVAGTLSGISDGVAQSYTTSAISPWGTTTTVDNGKIAQYGVANGVGKAADQLAEYNIKRAEQYHPVIQLTAGTVVDVVFLKGFYVDGEKHNKDPKSILQAQGSGPLFSSSGSSFGSPGMNGINRSYDSMSGVASASGSPPNNGVMSSGNSGSSAISSSTLEPLPLTPQQIESLKSKNMSQGFSS